MKNENSNNPSVVQTVIPTLSTYVMSRPFFVCLTTGLIMDEAYLIGGVHGSFTHPMCALSWIRSDKTALPAQDRLLLEEMVYSDLGFQMGDFLYVPKELEDEGMRPLSGEYIRWQRDTSMWSNIPFPLVHVNKFIEEKRKIEEEAKSKKRSKKKDPSGEGEVVVVSSRGDPSKKVFHAYSLYDDGTPHLEMRESKIYQFAEPFPLKRITWSQNKGAIRIVFSDEGGGLNTQVNSLFLDAVHEAHGRVFFLTNKPIHRSSNSNSVDD